MFYVYILQSKKNLDKIYIGYSSNLKQRLQEHNDGDSKYTSRFKPWSLIYYEGFANESDARKRESRLKQFDNTWHNLRRRIDRCFHKDHED